MGTLEIKATPVPTGLGNYVHTYLLYTDNTGNQSIARGGRGYFSGDNP
jgi:hypothetical protein